jgi:hypothetical protein
MRSSLAVPVLVALLTGLLVPADALGATAHPKTVPASRPASAPTAAEHWLATQAKAITAAGGHYVTGMSARAAAAAALPAESFDGDEILPAGHLAGGKDLDVLDIQQTLTKLGTRYADVALRHGRTGALIWRISFQEADNSLAGFSVGRVGSNGAPAVIITNAETYSSGTVANFVLTIDAVSGQTGQNVWGNAITGSYDTGTGIETNEPFLTGNFHGLKGPATDVLFTTVTGSNSTQTFTAQADLIAGATGHQAAIGPGFPSLGDGTVLAPVGDLNGDGLSDIVELPVGATGSARALTATGKTLWTKAIPISSADEVLSLGPLSHADYPDLAVKEQAMNTPSDYVVLNGRTGRKEFSVSTRDLYPLGRVGKHRVRALGELDLAPTFTTTRTTVTATWAAVSATGARIYHHSDVATIAVPAGDHGGSSTDAGWSGDVQGDGAIEQSFAMTAQDISPSSTTDKTIAGFIDGRTGTFHPSAATQVSDGSLVAGKGDDLLRLTLRGGVPQLAAAKGTTRKKYYSRAIPHVTAASAASLAGMRVTGNKCSDFGLVATNESVGATVEIGVLTARGQPLWMVNAAAINRGIGTLTRFATPKHFCL